LVALHRVFYFKRWINFAAGDKNVLEEENTALNLKAGGCGGEKEREKTVSASNPNPMFIMGT